MTNFKLMDNATFAHALITDITLDEANQLMTVTEDGATPFYRERHMQITIKAEVLQTLVKNGVVLLYVQGNLKVGEIERTLKVQRIYELMTEGQHTCKAKPLSPVQRYAFQNLLENAS